MVIVLSQRRHFLRRTVNEHTNGSMQELVEVGRCRPSELIVLIPMKCFINSSVVQRHFSIYGLHRVHRLKSVGGQNHDINRMVFERNPFNLDEISLAQFVLFHFLSGTASMSVVFRFVFRHHKQNCFE